MLLIPFHSRHIEFDFAKLGLHKHLCFISLQSQVLISVTASAVVEIVDIVGSLPAAHAAIKKVVQYSPIQSNIKPYWALFSLHLYSSNHLAPWAPQELVHVQLQPLHIPYFNFWQPSDEGVYFIQQLPWMKQVTVFCSWVWGCSPLFGSYTHTTKYFHLHGYLLWKMCLLHQA